MTTVASPVEGAGQRRTPPRVFGKTWVTFAVILMLVVSEYRWDGGRTQEAALAGDADTRGLVELALYGIISALLLTYVARPPTGRRMPALMVVRWGFTLSTMFVAFWSPFPKLAIARAVQMIIVTWLCHLIASEAEETQLWRLVHAYIVLVAGSVVAGFVVPRVPLYGQEDRFTWFSTHPNVSGSFMAIATVLVIAALLVRRQRSPYTPWPQWAYLCVFLLIFGGLLLCRSRGALAGAVVGIGVVMWSASRRRSRLDLAMVSGCIFGCIYLLAKGDIVAWLTRGETDEQISSLNSRTEVWTQGWELFGDRPVFGWGYMSSRGVFLDTFGLGGAHNAFFEVLVNAGLFGIFWWLALIILAIGAASRLGAQRHPDGPMLLGVLAMLVINGLTDGGLGLGTTVHGIWLSVVVGWLLAVDRWREEDARISRKRWRPPAARGEGTRWVEPSERDLPGEHGYPIDQPPPQPPGFGSNR